MSENKVGAGILNIITESLYDNPIVVFVSMCKIRWTLF